jgi:hypothetical protein
MLKKIFVPLFLIFLFIIGINSAQAAQAHPPGTLVKVGSTVWRISDDGTSRQAIDSVEKFYSHRFNFINVVTANVGDTSLPDSGFLPWGDGVIFSYNNIIYQVSGGQRHGFISAEVYLGQGFTFSMTRPGNLAGLAEGTPVRQASERHLPGTFLKDSQGTIWRQEVSGAKPFPSAAIFFSHGGIFSDVVGTNSADDHLPNALAMNYRAGSLVNDSGTIWATTGTTKLSFPSAPCFLNFGFNFGMTLSGSTASLSPGSSICADPATGPVGGISSYSTSTLQTSAGSFQARIATFNLSSGKIQVITDTAADRDCSDDCPVASLPTYISVNGAQSGINGTYFCPQDYPECASQSNSFFWKVYDTKAGKMINANSGLGEQDPFLAFDASGHATYFSKWSDFNNSHFSATAGINSYGMIENGTISLNYSKLDDKQKTVKSIRGAVGIKGQTLYLIQVLNATIPDTALVLQAMGLDYALGLDGGGSSALIYQNSQKTVGGRSIPNAFLVQELP